MSTSSGQNPVLAPIRRWVLYSRTHLVITIAGSVAALFAIGAVVGEDPQPARTTSGASISVAESASPAETISYDLDEVSESLIAAKSTTWAHSTAPATAMAYAHTFVDTIPSDAMWSATIGHYTAAEPGSNFLAARPRTTVVITGPTKSTLSPGPDGSRIAQVTVPTQAGDLRLSLRVDESGQRWVVDTPLPTLELSEVEKVAIPPTTARTPSSSASQPAPTTTTSAPTSTSAPQATFDLDALAPEPVEPAPTFDAGPSPVPGPIPIPELDTPIPGAR